MDDLAVEIYVVLSLQRSILTPDTVAKEALITFTGHKNYKTMKKYIAMDEKGRRKDVEKVFGCKEYDLMHYSEE